MRIVYIIFNVLFINFLYIFVVFIFSEWQNKWSFSFFVNLFPRSTF